MEKKSSADGERPVPGRYGRGRPLLSSLVPIVVPGYSKTSDESQFGPDSRLAAGAWSRPLVGVQIPQSHPPADQRGAVQIDGENGDKDSGGMENLAAALQVCSMTDASTETASGFPANRQTPTKQGSAEGAADAPGHGRAGPYLGPKTKLDDLIDIGAPTPMDISASPHRGLLAPGIKVISWQTFAIKDPTFLPVAVAPLDLSDGRHEIIFCDLRSWRAYYFDSSPMQAGERGRPVYVIDMHTELGRLRQPSAVAVADAGKVIALQDKCGIHIFDAATKEYLQSPVASGSLHGVKVRSGKKIITMDVKDRILISSRLDQRDRVDDEDWALTHFLPRESVNSQANRHRGHVSRHGNGSKYRYIDVQPNFDYSFKQWMAITDWGQHLVHVVDVSIGVRIRYTVGGFGAGYGQFHDPAGVAFLMNLHLAVADSKNRRIQVFDTEGSLLGMIPLPPTVGRPVGLFFNFFEDKGENVRDLYVSHYGPHALPGITKLTLAFEP